MADKNDPLEKDLGPAATDRDRRALRHSAAEDAGLRAFAVEAARLLSDRHCQEVVVLDVRPLSDLTDYLVIATGTSDRQIRSVSDELEDLGEEHGLSKFGRDADARNTWVVVDFVDVIVHVFEQTARAHYDLEMLWGDAQRVEWKR